MGKVIAVCISEKKGTQKHPVEEAEFVEDWGIKNDAHAGKWHRQVSLLSYDKIEAFRARGAEVEDGAFGENLVVQGFDFSSLFTPSICSNSIPARMLPPCRTLVKTPSRGIIQSPIF